MKLTESFPTTVEGCEVYTGFREWILFGEMLADDDLSDLEKSALMNEWFVDATPADYRKGLEGLVDFYVCERKPGEKEAPKVYDFEEDAGLIFAGFLQAYGIDLTTAELHWWAFTELLINIPDETRLAQVMGIRGMDTSAMRGEEKAHYDKLKKLCALGADAPRPKTLEERDAELIRRLRRQ